MFAIANGRKALWQWDLNQQLTVAGSCTEVHYLDKGSPSTLTVAVKDGKADIPNILLQKAGRLIVYAYIIDAQDHHTKICETFGIAARPKPNDYVYTETEVKTWSDLQSQIGDLANLATEEKDNLVAAINEVKASSGSGEASDAVLYTEQSLTEEQKAQARENIGGVRPVITLNYSFIGNGFTWNYTATEIQALREKKYLFDVNGCHANCNFYGGNMRVSWVDGNELKYSDIDNSGKSREIFFSDIGGITGQVTADKVTNPDHPTDLVQYGAFEAAVPLVQSMDITGAQVGQTIKVKAVNEQGMPTAWEAADMASGEEQWELNATYQYSDLQFPAAFDLSGAKEWIIVFSAFYADVNTNIGVKFGISITYSNVTYFTFSIGTHSYGNAGIIHYRERPTVGVIVDANLGFNGDGASELKRWNIPNPSRKLLNMDAPNPTATLKGGKIELYRRTK